MHITESPYISLHRNTCGLSFVLEKNLAVPFQDLHKSSNSNCFFQDSDKADLRAKNCQLSSKTEIAERNFSQNF